MPIRVYVQYLISYCINVFHRTERRYCFELGILPGLATLIRVAITWTLSDISIRQLTGTCARTDTHTHAIKNGVMFEVPLGKHAISEHEEKLVFMCNTCLELYTILRRSEWNYTIENLERFQSRNYGWLYAPQYLPNVE